MSNSIDFAKQIVAVGVGGMIGATARYSVSLLLLDIAGFPIATLSVNLMGCFVLSYLLTQPSLRERLSPTVFTALGTGLIGSFTTFSTFAMETISLFQVSPLQAILYICVSIIGGLSFCFLGFKIACGRRESK